MRVRPNLALLGTVALVGALWPLLPADAEGGKIPDVLYADWRLLTIKDFPTWVSSEAARDQQGRIASHLFPPRWSSRIGHLQTLPFNPSGSCIVLDPPAGWHHSPTPASTLSEALEAAKVVVIGEITARAAGFERGWPGWMTLVETNEAIKGAVLDHYYIFLPQGRVPTSLGTYCLDDSRFPGVAPGVGDRAVLIFEYIENLGQPYVDSAWENRVALLPRDGSVEVAKGFLETDSRGGATRARKAPDVPSHGEALLAEIRAWAADRGGAQ